jgi:3,4-dihydroxy 2-butanone 4-phosphate synthase/GTP cyclohydrolase II
LSNNPEKLESLTSTGIKASLQFLSGEINTFNEKYVATKKERLGHK